VPDGTSALYEWNLLNVHDYKNGIIYKFTKSIWRPGTRSNGVSPVVLNFPRTELFQDNPLSGKSELSPTKGQQNN
jgi:hypothetical protein